jgi:hypothetical protein
MDVEILWIAAYLIGEQQHRTIDRTQRLADLIGQSGREVGTLDVGMSQGSVIFVSRERNDGQPRHHCQTHRRGHGLESQSAGAYPGICGKYSDRAVVCVIRIVAATLGIANVAHCGAEPAISPKAVESHPVSSERLLLDCRILS